MSTQHETEPMEFIAESTPEHWLRVENSFEHKRIRPFAIYLDYTECERNITMWSGERDGQGSRFDVNMQDYDVRFCILKRQFHLERFSRIMGTFDSGSALGIFVPVLPYGGDEILLTPQQALVVRLMNPGGRLKQVITFFDHFRVSWPEGTFERGR